MSVQRQAELKRVIALEISCQNRIVFQGTFSSLNAAQDFSAWWASQSSLPQGGAIHQESERMKLWRDANPFPVDKLTRVQRRLITSRLNGSCPCGKCQWANQQEDKQNANTAI